MQVTTQRGRKRWENFPIRSVSIGLLAGLAILLFTLFPASPERSNAPTNETIASDTNTIHITSPSSFPNIKIKNFGQMDEHFYRGAQPDPDDYRTLAALGIKTIVDLRDDPTKYEKKDAEAAGIHYFNIQMSDKKKPSDGQILEFFKIADDTANQPFYVHCAGGRHRTGLIGAVYRYNKYGWNYDQVYEEMKNYDYYSRWGHGAIKDYVQEYYDKLKNAKAPVAIDIPDTKAVPSQPVTVPPFPRAKE